MDKSLHSRISDILLLLKLYFINIKVDFSVLSVLNHREFLINTQKNNLPFRSYNF